jgi:hypothetical protein
MIAARRKIREDAMELLDIVEAVSKWFVGVGC